MRVKIYWLFFLATVVSGASIGGLTGYQDAEETSNEDLKIESEEELESSVVDRQDLGDFEIEGDDLKDFDVGKEDLRSISEESEDLENFEEESEDFGNLEEESEDFGNLEVEPPPGERDATLSLRGKIKPWPNATVPYAIWGSDATKDKVHTAFNKIEGETCVRFEPRQGQARYLLIKEGDGGCWTSSLGFPSTYKKVTINLGSGCVHGKQIKHEIYHALGFPHEHSRPDRTGHISIKWDNIKDGASSQFSMNENYPVLEVPYDLHSIMHYGRYDFAKDPSKPTIVPTPWVEGQLGGDNLSYRDKRKLNVFYGCLEYLDES